MKATTKRQSGASHASNPLQISSQRNGATHAFQPPSPEADAAVFFQPKLLISRQSDPYEREADAVADQVVEQQAVAAPAAPITSTPPLIQPLIQRKPIFESPGPTEQESEADGVVQMKAEPAGAGVAASGIAADLAASRAQGRPLPETAKSKMERGFGRDFSAVRIHTGAGAAAMNRKLGAQAFTHGRDIYFNAGNFRPEEKSGAHLLAHELTHTIQQQGGKAIQKRSEKDADPATRPVPASPEENLLPPELETLNTPEESPAAQAGPPAAAASASNPAAGPGAKAKPAAAPTPETSPSQKGIEEVEDTPLLEDPGKEAIPDEGAEMPPRAPEDDPAFQAVAGKSRSTAKGQQAHEPAAAKSAEAQAAAVSPASETESLAQSNQVAQMEAAETPAFDAAGFKAALMERIKAAMPKDLEEADEFKDGKKLDAAKSDMTGQVDTAKDASQGPVEETTQAEPDTSSVEARVEEPLPPADPGPAPGGIGAAQAVPGLRSPVEIEQPLQERSQAMDDQMASANITEEQLAISNEPKFLDALGAKQEAQADAAQASEDVRTEEQGQLVEAKGEASAAAEKQLSGMYQDRVEATSDVEGQQLEAKAEDEALRARIAQDINVIYEDTKSKVESILSKLDQDVEQAFDAGADAAQAAFVQYVDQRMRAYKDERYSGVSGAALWAKDQILSVPSEVNIFFVEGRNLFLERMEGVINEVVRIVGDALTAAKEEIANGKQRVQEYVDTQLPDELKSLGQEVAVEFQGKFDELEASVDAKQGELVETLSQKYVDRVNGIDAEIEKRKEANKGLVDRASEAIQAVREAIAKVEELMLGLLSKVAAVISTILADPIGFLGNLISGVTQGLNNFMANILKHLKDGLFAWLTSATGGMNITMPENIFSLEGIFSLVTQILGINYAYIRQKAVKLFGEEVVGFMEKSVDILMVLINEGLPGLWRLVKEQFNNLKEMVIDQIMSLIQTKVIQAGIKWILGLLSPVGAFIKAAMAIYDIVMFFVQKAKQLFELVNAFVDAIADIAAGNVSAVAQKVEDALGKAVPVVIGFLASLLGISDLVKKVQDIIQKLRAKVDQAVDKLLEKVKGLFKGKSKEEGETGDPEHDAKLKIGLEAIDEEEKKYLQDGDKISLEDAEKVAATVKAEHPVFKSIEVVGEGETWDYSYVASKGKKPGKKKVLVGAKALPDDFDVRQNLYIRGSGWEKTKGSIKERDTKERVKRLAVIFLLDNLSTAEKRLKYHVELGHYNDDVFSYLKKPDIVEKAQEYAEKYFDKTPYEVDHLTPLAAHWVKYGFNSGDESRWRITVDKDNLKYVTQEFNRSMGGMGFTYKSKFWVGPNFKSQYADEGKPNPETILDGRSKRKLKPKE
jgi:hypothetical protein